ncbi:hypothetical protein MHYP_G00101230, partial [Metynnis hypsauchen]
SVGVDPFSIREEEEEEEEELREEERKEESKERREEGPNRVFSPRCDSPA